MQQTVQDKLDTYFGQYKLLAYAKGQVIVSAGDDPAGVMLLLEGIVEQYDITPEGNRVTVNMFKPRAFFPMSWAINRGSNTYFYAAHTDVRLKCADADATVSFLRLNPDVMFDLLSRVYKGTDALLQKLVLATSGIASNRLIFELLIEAYRFGETIDSTRVLIHAKQYSLAARSGLARETVSRELHKLQNDTLILLTRRGIELNIKKLEKQLGNSQ